MKNDNFEQSQIRQDSAEVSERGTLWDFQTSILLQKIKKKKGGPFGTIKKFSKKRSIVPKQIQVKNTQIAKVGILSCFQGSRRWFYSFGWGSKVCGKFWSN